MLKLKLELPLHLKLNIIPIVRRETQLLYFPNGHTQIRACQLNALRWNTDAWLHCQMDPTAQERQERLEQWSTQIHQAAETPKANKQEKPSNKSAEAALSPPPKI